MPVVVAYQCVEEHHSEKHICINSRSIKFLDTKAGSLSIINECKGCGNNQSAMIGNFIANIFDRCEFRVFWFGKFKESLKNYPLFFERPPEADQPPAEALASREVKGILSSRQARRIKSHGFSEVP